MVPPFDLSEGRREGRKYLGEFMSKNKIGELWRKGRKGKVIVVAEGEMSERRRKEC